MGLPPSTSLFSRRCIEIKIIDDEEYEKNKNFHIELGPPELLDTGPRHGDCTPVAREGGGEQFGRPCSPVAKRLSVENPCPFTRAEATRRPQAHVPL